METIASKILIFTFTVEIQLFCSPHTENPCIYNIYPRCFPGARYVDDLYRISSGNCYMYALRCILLEMFSHTSYIHTLQHILRHFLLDLWAAFIVMLWSYSSQLFAMHDIQTLAFRRVSYIGKLAGILAGID